MSGCRKPAYATAALLVFGLAMAAAPHDVQAPPKPTGLTMLRRPARGDTVQVWVYWRKVAGAVNYELWVRPNTGAWRAAPQYATTFGLPTYVRTGADTEYTFATTLAAWQSVTFTANVWSMTGTLSAPVFSVDSAVARLSLSRNPQILQAYLLPRQAESPPQLPGGVCVTFLFRSGELALRTGDRPRCGQVYETHVLEYLRTVSVRQQRAADSACIDYISQVPDMVGFREPCYATAKPAYQWEVAVVP